MSKLSEKARENNIIKRIRRLVDEKGVRIAAISMESGIMQGTIKALYEDKPSNKAAISSTTADKVEAGLDRYETRLGMVKHCPTCERDLPLGKFHFTKEYKDGVYYQCKECKKRKSSSKKPKKEMPKKGGTMNNCKDKAITKAIVERVKQDDDPSVDVKFAAPYFGVSQKQLAEIREGKWDSLLLTPKIPEKAESVLASVEALRGEVASLRREVEAVLIELGVDLSKHEAKA